MIDRTQETQLLSEAARQVVAERSAGLTIALVSSARTAGMLVDLLVRAHGLARKDIARLGNLATDEQNAAMLGRRMPIVVTPEDLVAHRGGTFYPPVGATQVVIIRAVEAPLEISRRPCDGQAFTLRW